MFLISHEYKCVFVHQRKAGGLSLIDSFGISKDQPGHHLLGDGVLSCGKSGCWKDKQRIAPRYHMFTVVRNPWDRFVSAWKYLGAYNNKSLPEVLQILPRNYERFADYVNAFREGAWLEAVRDFPRR